MQGAGLSASLQELISLLEDVGASVGWTSKVQFLHYRPIKETPELLMQKKLGGVSAFLAVYISKGVLAQVSVLCHMVRLGGLQTIWSKDSS